MTYQIETCDTQKSDKGSLLNHSDELSKNKRSKIVKKNLLSKVLADNI